MSTKQKSTGPSGSLPRLARCPFCGADESVQIDPRYQSPAVSAVRYADAGASTVECNACGGRGPLHDDHTEAIRLWNESWCEQLRSQLADIALQHFCGCGHPACKRCRDDLDNAALLALNSELCGPSRERQPDTPDQP